MSEQTRVLALRLDPETIIIFKAICLKRGRKYKEQFTEMVLTYAQEHKIDSDEPTEPDASEATKLIALNYIRNSTRNPILKSCVLSSVEDSLICEVARLHYHVNNSLVRGAPRKELLKGIVFKLNTNEREGAKKYLEYFDKNVLPKKGRVTSSEMFDLAKQLRLRLKQA